MLPPDRQLGRRCFAFADSAGSAAEERHDHVRRRGRREVDDACDSVDAGAESHAVSTYALDGTAAPVGGNIEADTTAVKMPAPNVPVMAPG